MDLRKTIPLLQPHGGGAKLLDQLGLSATAAFSLRKLRSAYHGACVNIRRSSDNATLDIGFTGAGAFDAGTFAAFIGAGSGFAAKWYDQGGLADDAVQATAANQPQLVLNSINGKPSLSFTTASSQFLTLTNTLFSGYTALGWAAVMQSSNTTSSLLFAKNDAAQQYAETTINNGGNVTAELRNATPTTQGATFGTDAAILNGSPHALNLSWDGTTITPYLDGVAKSTAALSSPLVTNATATTIGARSAGPQSFYTGNLGELIIWNASIAATQSALYANQKAYWGTP